MDGGSRGTLPPPELDVTVGILAAAATVTPLLRVVGTAVGLVAVVLAASSLVAAVVVVVVVVVVGSSVRAMQFWGFRKVLTSASTAAASMGVR